MRRIDVCRGVFFLSVFLGAATSGFGQTPDKSGLSLTGTVFADGTNQRVAHAGAILCEDGGQPLQQLSASDTGEFSFQGLRTGNYLLRVEAGGFESAEVRVDLSLASAHGLSIHLKRARVAGAPEGAMVSTHELAMPGAARALFDAGKKKLYTEKKAAAALKDFQGATKKAPMFYEAYYQAGMAQLALRDSSEAEKNLRKAVNLSEKKYADADVALGTFLLHRGESPEGEELLREGLAWNPRNWSGQFELGRLELNRGHLDEALVAARDAKELAPREPMIYRLLAAIHVRQKKYPELIADLDGYLQLDPDSPSGQRAKELRAAAEKQVAMATSTVSANK